MTKNDIALMLSDIVEELDYDLWKELFLEDCIQDPEWASCMKDRLENIVRSYLYG